MEEDIKVLEEFIEQYNTDEDLFCFINYSTIQAIENLIKRNEELEEMLKHRIKYTNELEKDLFENASNYVIPKSKLEEILDRYAYTKLDDEEKIIRFYKDLQELLEERN